MLLFFLKIIIKNPTDFWCLTLLLTLDFRTAKQQRHPLTLPKGLIQVPKTKHTKSLVTAVKAARGCPSRSPSPAQPGSRLGEAGTAPRELRATLCDPAGSTCSHEQTLWSGHNSHTVTETVELRWAQSRSSADVNQWGSTEPIHTPAQDEMSLNHLALKMQEAKCGP